jgi:DNA-binding SARP family transcriptional activator
MKTNLPHSIAPALALLLLSAAATRAEDTPSSSAAAARIGRLEKMLAASPDNPGIMYRLAVVEAGTGRHADAIRWLEKVAAMGYDFDAAKEPAFAPLEKFESFNSRSTDRESAPRASG